MTATPDPRLSKSWWLVLLQGIAVLILGLLFLTSPVVTTAMLILFIGAYWLVDGVFSLVRIFLKDSDVHWGWLLAKGIIGILAGIYVLANPLVSLVILPATLIIIIAIQGIVMGVIGVIQAFRGGGWSAGLLGAVNIIIGTILLMRPLLAATVLPLVLGIFGLVFGVILIIASFRVRSSGNA